MKLFCACIFVILFITSVSEVKSLECYSCSGELGYNSGVNDCERFWYDDKYKKMQCLPGEQVCAKYIVQHSGIRMVHRACQSFDVCQYLENKYNNPRDQLLECHTCSDRNFCNSSESLRPTLFGIVTIVVSSVFILNKVSVFY